MYIEMNKRVPVDLNKENLNVVFDLVKIAGLKSYSSKQIEMLLLIHYVIP